MKKVTNVARSLLLRSVQSFVWGATVLVALATIPPICLAQVSSGGITGVVSDPGGALVPNAQITVTNIETGQGRKVLSDSSGIFNIPSLVPGTYRFVSSAEGFASSSVDVKVTLNQTTRQDVHLVVAGASQTVEVASNFNLLQTESHEVGSVLDGATVEALPSASRDVFSTLASQQNVATYNGSNSNSDVQSYGTGQNALVIGSMTTGSTSYLQDGVNNFNLETKTANLQPSPETVAAVSIQSNGASARFDEPTVVNVTTKAGTNQFHGTVYEYLQNDIFNAKTYYNAGPNSPLRFNQFGANIGGPIIKNKLQFFAAYDGLRSTNGYQVTAFLPTAAERTGDFSADAPIYDPNTYNATAKTISQFPGNQIPANRISSFAKTFFQYMPPANGSSVPGQNTTKNVRGTNTYDNYLGRIDYTIGSNDSVYGAFERNNPVSNNPGVLGSIFDQQYLLTATNVYAQETHIFSPTLINIARFGYNRSKLYETPAGAGKADYTAQFGVPIIKPNPSVDTPPDLVFYSPGYEDLGNAFAPDGATQQIFEYLNEVNKTVGKHSLFFGAEFDRVLFDGNWSIWSDGSFVFQGDFTGNHNAVNATQPGSAFQTATSSYADLLLGLPYQAIAGIGPTYGNFRQIFAAPYFQDDWSTTPNLKLNLGLRWDFYQAPNDSLGHSNVYDVTTNTNHRGTFNEQYGNFAPRIGFAYSPTSRFVIRGGYGIYYSTFMYNELQFLLANTPNFFLEYNVYNFDNPTPISQSLFANPSGSALSAFTTQLNMKTPTTQEYNLALQHSFGKSMTATATYVGIKSQHLQQRINPNQIQVGTGKRPYSWIGDVNQASDVGWQLSNALQLDFTKTYSHGLSFNANYVWSKALDDMTGDNLNTRNGTNLKLDYGRSDFDRTSVLKISGVYDFQLPRTSSWTLRQTLGNWQMSGIFYTQTGTPFSINASYDAGIGGNNQPYANQLCNGSLANRTPSHWFNTACFVTPKNGTIGNAGRNDLVGPGSTNLDASIAKKVTFREQLGLQLRLDLFGAFNHPIYSFGGGQVVGQGGFGAATVVGGSRRLQLSSKFTF